jgi:hypothetical protein
MIRTASHVHGNVAVTAFVCDLEAEHGQDQRLPA